MIKMIACLVTHSILVRFGRLKAHFDGIPARVTGTGCCGYGYGSRARYPGVYPCSALVIVVVVVVDVVAAVGSGSAGAGVRRQPCPP